MGLAEHTVVVNRRGQELAIQDSAAPIRDRAGNLIGAVMVFHDVSKERRLHRALHYQASHDALTGLINRREFENRLTVAVENARQDAGTPPRAAVPGSGSIQIGQRYLRTSGRRSAAEADHRGAAIAGAQRRHPGTPGRRRVRHPAAELPVGSGDAHRGEPAPGDSRFSLHLAGRRTRGRASASASSRSPAKRRRSPAS